VHIKTWRNTAAGAGTTYDIAAYWQIDRDVWVQLAAQAGGRGGQEDLLAALRTLRGI
jgi:hypothetical protein